MATPAGKTFTWDEVAQHNSVSAGVWVVIDGLVYDVTQFVDEHPGGDEVLLDNAGKDATSAFRDVGHSEDAVGLRDGFCIGRIASDDPPSEETPPSPTSSQLKAAVGVAAGFALPALVLLAAVAAGYFIYRRYKH